MPICTTPDTPRPPSAAPPPSPIASLPMHQSTHRHHGEHASQWCLAADALSSSVVVTIVISSHIISVIGIMQQSTINSSAYRHLIMQQSRRRCHHRHHHATINSTSSWGVGSVQANGASPLMLLSSRSSLSS